MGYISDDLMRFIILPLSYLDVLRPKKIGLEGMPKGCMSKLG